MDQCLPTRSGRQNISTSSCLRLSRRARPLAYEAWMNALNSGCASSGFDFALSPHERHDDITLLVAEARGIPEIAMKVAEDT